MEGSRVQHTCWGGAQDSAGGGCQVTQAPYLSAPPRATHRRDHSHASHMCTNSHTRMPRPTHVDTQLGRQSTSAHTLSWTHAHSWIPTQHTQTPKAHTHAHKTHPDMLMDTHRPTETHTQMHTHIHRHTAGHADLHSLSHSQMLTRHTQTPNTHTQLTEHSLSRPQRCT